MSYRIDYTSPDAIRKPVVKKHSLAGVAAAACVCALVAGAMIIKNTGLDWVQRYLLPGDPAVTASALENMADSLKSGEPILDAVTAFCREIVANAN